MVNSQASGRVAGRRREAQRGEVPAASEVLRLEQHRPDAAPLPRVEPAPPLRADAAAAPPRLAPCAALPVPETEMAMETETAMEMAAARQRSLAHHRLERVEMEELTPELTAVRRQATDVMAAVHQPAAAVPPRPRAVVTAVLLAVLLAAPVPPTLDVKLNADGFCFAAGNAMLAPNGAQPQSFKGANCNAHEVMPVMGVCTRN